MSVRSIFSSVASVLLDGRVAFLYLALARGDEERRRRERFLIDLARVPFGANVSDDDVIALSSRMQQLERDVAQYERIIEAASELVGTAASSSPLQRHMHAEHAEEEDSVRSVMR